MFKVQVPLSDSSSLGADDTPRACNGPIFTEELKDNRRAHAVSSGHSQPSFALPVAGERSDSREARSARTSAQLLTSP